MQAQGDADDGVLNFGTPPRQRHRLFLATARTQQFAIAATHQRKTGLHQADSAVAQIVGFPGPFRDMRRAEQFFRDSSIGMPLGTGIERTQRERKPLSPL